MNARKFIGASVLTIALILGAAGTANADHILCSTELGDLSNAIGDAVYKNEHDKTRMQATVTEAGLKLLSSKHKFGDAEDKVASINVKVKALRDATRAKIFDDVGTEIEDILVEVDNVLACIPGGDASLPH